MCKDTIIFSEIFLDKSEKMRIGIESPTITHRHNCTLKLGIGMPIPVRTQLCLRADESLGMGSIMSCQYLSYFFGRVIKIWGINIRLYLPCQV